MLSKILVVCSVFVVVVCKKGRDPKFVSFNYEDRDIAVDLDFSIPFLTIPFKKTVDTFGVSGIPSININPAALVLGGAVVLGTTVLLPLLMKHFVSNSDYRYSRILDHPELSADAVIEFANKMVSDGGSISGCLLRVACWTGQRDQEFATAVQRFTSNKLLSPFINSTAVEKAIESGKSGRDCATYRPCPVEEQFVPVFMNNLAVLAKSGVS